MRNRINIFVIVFQMLVPAIAYGDTEAGPFPYARTSADGKFIFVMFTPGHVHPAEVPLVDGRQVFGYIPASDYPASGLYANNGSRIPLWTVTWYAHSVIVLSDGIHLVRRGPWAKSQSDEAYSFYANGKEVRSYKISDLVDTPLFLKHSVSHFEWEETVRIDEQNHELVTALYNTEGFVFDYTTGEIISSRRPFRAVLLVCGTALVLLAGWTAILIIGRVKRKQHRL